MNRNTLTRFAASLVIVAAVIGTSAATSAVHRLGGTAAAVKVAPRAHLMAFGGRSAAQQRSGMGAKFDAALADLSRHSNRARAGSAGLMDLHSMNPAAHFVVGGVSQTISAWLAGDVKLGPDELVDQLTSLLDDLADPKLAGPGITETAAAATATSPDPAAKGASS